MRTSCTSRGVETRTTTMARIAEVLAAVRSIPPKNRTVEHWRERIRQMLREKLLKTISLNELESAARAVAERRRDPYSVVDEILQRFSY